MRSTLEMAREAGWPIEAGEELPNTGSMSLERLVELARADARNSWPSEMEAMERQVNILTDALAKAKADERQVCMDALNALPYKRPTKYDCMDAIRARSET